MSAAEHESSKCSRRTALSIFFAIELLAYTFSCIALISPTWQYVYLENGRTEHHHGLWLDCKRDYSHEYGRNREFYETLYRLDKQQTPFDQFFLPPLLCVYKFDYYIDTEDLYDHNHDENRLQDDANQHLFLGWKIASLAAFGFATLLAGVALLLMVCAFCHGTLICAAVVLITIAALFSSAGLAIFYIWANYQDNNIIKEDDGIYEQFFGWAYYLQIVGTLMHFIASFMGCIATSVALRKRRSKLVKIEVVDEDDGTAPLNASSVPPFKRSFSAIYKVDSAALRKWEKEYMAKMGASSVISAALKQDNFKRTTSMPNVKKGRLKSKQARLYNSNKLMHSTSNIPVRVNETGNGYSVNATATGKCWPNTVSIAQPKSILKSSSKQMLAINDINRAQSTDQDLTYEYLPYESSANITKSMETLSKLSACNVPGDSDQSNRCTMNSRLRSETPINVYDKVYEHISLVPPSSPDEYEQPNSHRTNRSNDTKMRKSASKTTFGVDDALVPTTKMPFKSTVINDVAGRHAICSTRVDFDANARKRYSDGQMDSRQALLNDQTGPWKLSFGERGGSTTLSLRDFAVERKDSSFFSPKTATNSSDQNIDINTFDGETFTKCNHAISNGRSAFRPGDNGSSKLITHSQPQHLNTLRDEDSMRQKRKTDSLIKTILSPTTNSNDIKRYFDDEVDRSVGSSTTFENDMLRDNYREAELHLNLFMNGARHWPAGECFRLSGKSPLLPLGAGNRNNLKLFEILGGGWRVIEGEAEGHTQTDLGELIDNAYFSHPIDVHLATKTLQGWPVINLQIWHYDEFGRQELYAYGSTFLPVTPGEHKITCHTWRPRGSLRDEIMQYFVGGGLQLKSKQSLGRLSENSKLRVVSMGQIDMQISIITRYFDRFGIQC